jgi:hypothetical protein
VWQLRLAVAVVHGDVHVGRVGNVRRSGHVRTGRAPVAELRQLRLAVCDVHVGMHVGRVGNVRQPGSVFARRTATVIVRFVLARDLYEQLHVGRLHVERGQRVQLQQRLEPPGVFGVPVRSAVVPEFVPLEHVVHLVLHVVRRLQLS